MGTSTPTGCTKSAPHKNARAGFRPGFLLILGKFLDGGGKAGEALELRGDDDLGCLAVGHLLHSQDGLGLALGASWSSLLLVLR